MDSDAIEDTAEPTEEEGNTETGDDIIVRPEPDEAESSTDETEPETFPREVVEKLRQESGRYRQRAQHADTLARRLHTELVRATGRLADPTDLAFDEEHLEDPDALAAALGDLLDRKPHLASRKPVGDVGQGNRGASSEPFSLLGLLKERT
jgi:hypothetical protein